MGGRCMVGGVLVEVALRGILATPMGEALHRL